MSRRANPKAVSASVLATLRRYDTPTVCNVIELFDARPHSAGFMDARIRAAFPELPPMVGFAATATFRSAAPAGGQAYSTIEEQIAAFEELPGPPVVVFQDLDDPAAAATFGEIMCTSYRAFGAAGLVTSGAGRDLDQVRALKFPVFTGGTICAHGYCHIPSIGVPVRVGGVTVRPGDLLHGDLNGVTTIPIEIASAVADACEEFMKAEAIVLERLKKGRPSRKDLKEGMAGTREAIMALKKHLKGKRA